MRCFDRHQANYTETVYIKHHLRLMYECFLEGGKKISLYFMVINKFDVKYGVQPIVV